ncbi:MAG: T9SS type A sorting domain-containing protein, partial [Bacteroidales bacterium]|nr:T9SS type A sorting domain-containing protein [Bacteroidales bacterium]
INGDTVIHDYGSGEYPNFFIRFDQSGNFIDYKKICRRAILCDVKFKDNHYYFMGTILANTDFLGYIPPGDSVSQGILVKLDTSANLVWAKTILSGAYTQIHSIHFLPGNIIAVGCKGNKGGGGACVLEFDDVPLPEWEWSRPTLAFLDESRLTFVGAVTIPTSGSTYVNNSTVNAILKDSRDNLIIGGYFTSQRIIIGEDTHANTGGEDIFIARYGWTCGEEAEWDYTGLRESPAGNAALRIYPNPTTGELRIENEELKIKNVEIFDIYGKNMGLSMDPSVHSSTITIDLSPLPAGIYLVKAMDEKGGVSVGKVVNQK